MPKFYEAVARLSEHGQPLLGDAQLILGDGTDKVQFTNGRATVTEDQARALSKRGDVVIIDPDAAPSWMPPEADLAEPEPTPATAVELPGAEQATAVSEAQGPPTPPVTDETAAAIEEAKAHLAEEGVEVPEPEGDVAKDVNAGPITLPAGFELKTAEGEDRCLAAKGDGTQCQNAAQGETHACGIESHKEQVAKLTA